MSATLKELTQAYMMNEVYDKSLEFHSSGAETFDDFVGDENILDWFTDILEYEEMKRKRKELLNNWCYQNFKMDYDTLMSWVGEENREGL
jgi:hypothetical protein